MEFRAHLRGVNQLQTKLGNWSEGRKRRVRQALQDVGNKWVTEAKLRVPVETGRLRNSIDKQIEGSDDDLLLRVGSNVKYGKYVEFGTTDIAGGRVKALGTGPIITDEEAVTSWPAKEDRGGRRQQMPWLRPAFASIRDKATKRIAEAMKYQGD